MVVNEVFKSAEELVLDVALWPFFAMKTFFWALVVPWKIPGYVLGEQKKKPAERYDELMSPVLCWLLCAVVPYFGIVQFWIARDHNRNAFLDALYQQPWELRLFFVALLLSIGPILFAMLINWRRKEPWSRESLRRTVATQCLCLTPASVALLPIFSATLIMSEPAKIQNFFNFWVGAFILSCLYCEISVLAQEYKDIEGLWDKTLTTAIGGMVAWLFATMFLTIVLAAVGGVVYTLTATAQTSPATLPGQGP